MRVAELLKAVENGQKLGGLIAWVSATALPLWLVPSAMLRSVLVSGAALGGGLGIWLALISDSEDPRSEAFRRLKQAAAPATLLILLFQLLDADAVAGFPWLEALHDSLVGFSIVTNSLLGTATAALVYLLLNGIILSGRSAPDAVRNLAGVKEDKEDAAG